MAQFINSNNRAFGMCTICGSEKYGSPNTYSSIGILENAGAVRVTDIVIADCGHIGFVTSGSSVLTIDGLQAATSESKIEGDYIAFFIDSLENIGGD